MRNTTDRLLVLLIDIVIATHNYEPMDGFRDRLKEIVKNED